MPRDEVFLTAKVRIEHYGYEKAKASVLNSMEKLKTDYLDLCLLHQPFADYYGAWRALEELYETGKIRAIGISNFYPDRMIDFTLADEDMRKIAALDTKTSAFFSHQPPLWWSGL